MSKWDLTALAAIVLVVVSVFCFPLLEKKEVPTVSQRAEVRAPEEPIVEKKVPEKSREGYRDEWFAAAQKVADQTGDPQALEIIRFLKENSVLAEPRINGYIKILEKPRGPNWCVLVPFTEKDVAMGGIWATRSSGSATHAAASFMPDSRIIVIKSQVPCSEIWKGLLLLHEGNHAYCYIHERYDWQNDVVFSEKERDTHEFENRITAKIGGKAYDDFLEKLIVEIVEETKKASKITEGRFIVHRTREYPELDEIFGTPESELERAYRATGVWIHAYFLIFDRTFVDAGTEKALFLRLLYHNTGVLPKK